MATHITGAGEGIHPPLASEDQALFGRRRQETPTASPHLTSRPMRVTVPFAEFDCRLTAFLHSYHGLAVLQLGCEAHRLWRDIRRALPGACVRRIDHHEHGQHVV